MVMTRHIEILGASEFESVCGRYSKKNKLYYSYPFPITHRSVNVFQFWNHNFLHGDVPLHVYQVQIPIIRVPFKWMIFGLSHLANTVGVY